MSRKNAGQVAAVWLAGAQFRERHSAVIEGDPEVILQALATLDDHDDMLVRLMFQLRKAPSRLWAALGGRSALTGRPRFGLKDFTTLQRDETTLVLGLAGQFWQLDFGLVLVEGPTAFQDLNRPNVAKLVMVYALESREDGRFDLVTETHVRCPDIASLAKFAPYWVMIRLGSGLIRRRILALVTRKMELLSIVT